MSALGIAAVSTVLAGMTLGGCSINPTYEVVVINDSRTNLNARIEHERKFDSSIILESVVVKADSERTLGPVEAPPLERVVLMIGATGNSISPPEHYVLKRGKYTVRVSNGTSTSWAPYEIQMIKE